MLNKLTVLKKYYLSRIYYIKNSSLILKENSFYQILADPHNLAYVSY